MMEQCYANDANTTARKKKLTAGNVISTIVSVFLAVILIIPVVLTAIVGAVKAQVSESSINSSVKEIRVFDIVDGSILNDYEHPDGKHTGFVAYMYQMIYPNETVIDDEKYRNFEDSVREIMDSDKNEASQAVREFVSEKLSAVIADIKNNTAHAEITADDIVELVEDIEDELETEFGFDITDADYEMIREEIEKREIVKLSVKAIKKGNEEIFKAIEYILSDVTFIILAAVGALLLILTIAVKGRHFQTGLIIGGASLALTGGAIYGFCVGINTLLDGFVLPKSMVGIDFIRRIAENRRVFAAFTAAARAYLGHFGFVVLIAAAVLIVVGILIAIVKGVKNSRVGTRTA